MLETNGLSIQHVENVQDYKDLKVMKQQNIKKQHNNIYIGLNINKTECDFYLESFIISLLCSSIDNVD